MSLNYTRHVVYPLYFWQRGIELGDKEARLEKSQWLSPKDVEALQWERLKRLLDHAWEHVPFYRRAWSELGITPAQVQGPEDFRRLPLLGKEAIREHASDLVAGNADRARLKADSTGGSTGEKVEFLEDPVELGWRWAATLRADRWAGLELGTRYAQVWGAAMDAPGYGGLGNRLMELATRRLFLSSADLSEARMEEFARRLAGFRPRVIVGYPSALNHFASFCLHRGLGLRVPSAICSGELLQGRQRETIAQAFGCQVFNRYGSREFAVMAMECPAHLGLHIFSDRFYVEVLRGGRPAAPGELGEVVVTDLHKYGMPLIRYRIGDAAVIASGPCECGRGLPLLERLEGRVFDVIALPGGRFVGGTFWTLLARSVPGVRKFQVVQEGPESLELRLVAEGELDPETLEELGRKVKAACGEVRLEIKLVEAIPDLPSGKQRLVVSKVPAKFT
jgi:phenylacetate-CoA ligase